MIGKLEIKGASQVTRKPRNHENRVTNQIELIFIGTPGSAVQAWNRSGKIGAISGCCYDLGKNKGQRNKA